MTSKPEWFPDAQLQGELQCEQPLAKHTTLRVGGFAERTYKPAGISDLAAFIKAAPADEPLFWIGLGSNLLIRDSGLNGTVILTQGNLNGIACLGTDKVRVEAGVSCAKMARFCARNDLSGGEFWAGIPGTMGGALRMNAGCFNGETWDRVVEVETMTRTGEIRRRSPAEFSISYRHVDGLRDEWFIAATCRLSAGDKNTSLMVIKDLLARRAATQPTNEYNCGSVFRNPSERFAAQLIESCGLKGARIGGAVISSKHANFIVNEGGDASAQHIESLIDLIQKEVYQQTEISLAREVHIIGERHA